MKNLIPFSPLLNYCGNRYGKAEPPKGVMTGDLMIDLDDSSHASGYPVGNSPAPGLRLSSTIKPFFA